MSSQSMSSFLSLPEELLSRICQALTDSRRSEKPLESLVNLCSTSKLLNRVARPFLCRDVELVGIRQLCSFVLYIANYPALAEVVRSISIIYDRDDDISEAYLSYVRKEINSGGFKNATVFENLISDGASDMSLHWILIVENLLSRTVGVTDLTIDVDGEDHCCFIFCDKDDEESRVHHGILPVLQNLTIRRVAGMYELMVLIKSMSRHQLDCVSLTNCKFGFWDIDREGIRSFALSVRKLRCYSINRKCSIAMPVLAQRCTNLEEFHYASLEDSIGIFRSSHLKANTIIEKLQDLRHTLRRLSLTTGAANGDDIEFPSLRNFEILEDLCIDANEIARFDYNPQNRDPEDGMTSNYGLGAEAGSDPDSDDDDTESDGPAYMPFLHLLPRSLKTLWLDNLADLEGGLETGLFLLARDAKTEFPNFRRIIVENPEELVSPDDLQEAFERRGIEFVKKPAGHCWFVEDGISSPDVCRYHRSDQDSNFDDDDDDDEDGEDEDEEEEEEEVDEDED